MDYPSIIVFIIVVGGLFLIIAATKEPFEPVTLAQDLAKHQQNEYELNRIVREVATGAMPPTRENFAGNWNSVRMRGDDNDMDWSSRIYSFIAGTPLDKTSAGVQHNATLLRSYQNLTKKKAMQLCQNPCYWSPARTNAIGNCLCTGRSPSGVPGFGV